MIYTVLRVSTVNPTLDFDGFKSPRCTSVQIPEFSQKPKSTAVNEIQQVALRGKGGEEWFSDCHNVNQDFKLLITASLLADVTKEHIDSIDKTENGGW